ncbi:HlyD family type I secretion periplasmic adaptor subunit [Candidatus Berkiella aquae]|uniref:Membrane fusion protein (MFP) family protein n=2 Tax=Candidatus Berkiella aquae TaxID=295108 RepID=A0A0Q9Z1T6_9GAMM|nr:HlyD family type I secretion periplasmic adaptor subunit [Candidatus Berkiella aquae]
MRDKFLKLRESMNELAEAKKKAEIGEVDVEFMTDSSAAMMQGIPFRYHLILIAAAAFLFVGGIWASFATLDVVTVAQGKVIPSRSMQTVQNLEGGIVKDIRVKVGEVVERGQVVMVIDDTRFVSSMKEGEVQSDALQAKIERLEAETSGKPLVFNKQLQENSPDTVRNELNLYENRKTELQVKLNILKDDVEQRKQELTGAQGKKEQLERSLALVKKELALTKPLVSQGAVSEVDVLRLERTVNDLAGELEQTQLSIPKLEASLTGAQRKIDELLLGFKSDAFKELNAARAEYSRLFESNKAAADRVTRTIVRSPVRGTVNQVKVTTIGGIVQPGQDLMDIVPLDDTLLIEANVRPSDIGFLRPGLPATVKISAYDFSIYGGLKAVVEHISADTITDEKGNSFYQIRVRTTEASYLVGKHGERLQIIPGMSATVDILTGQKTVLEYLLKPIIKAKRNAMRER